MERLTPEGLRASYDAALEHSDPLTDRISTDQFSRTYPERPAWAIGPFTRDESLTFRPSGQWPDPTGIGWTSSSVFNPSLIVDGDALHMFYRASPRKESTASRIGVATYTAELYHQGMFPKIVFTGANAPTTVERFPRGEAVHYREHALELGIPDSAILVEPRATNTGENIDFTRAIVETSHLDVRSIMLISRPYQQRRAYAMCRIRWSDIDVICASQNCLLDNYIAGIGDADQVVNMLVGDTQRVWTYAENGWALEQDVPDKVHAAYDRLVKSGFDRRVLK